MFKVVPKNRDFLPHWLKNPLNLQYRLLRLQRDLIDRRAKMIAKEVRVDSKTKRQTRRLLTQIDMALASGKVRRGTRLAEIIRHKRKYEKRGYSEKFKPLKTGQFKQLPVKAASRDIINAVGIRGLHILTGGKFTKEIKEYADGTEEYEIV